MNVNNLSISSWNIQGLGDKCSDDFFLSLLKYDINILLETWKGSDPNYNLADFKTFQKCRKEDTAEELLYCINQHFIREYLYWILRHLKIEYG